MRCSCRNMLTNQHTKMETSSTLYLQITKILYTITQFYQYYKAHLITVLLWFQQALNPGSWWWSTWTSFQIQCIEFFLGWNKLEWAQKRFHSNQLEWQTKQWWCKKRIPARTTKDTKKKSKVERHCCSLTKRRRKITEQFTKCTSQSKKAKQRTFYKIENYKNHSVIPNVTLKTKQLTQ